MKNILKLFSASMKAYAYSKMSIKTGMQVSEIILLKEGIKACEKYYTAKSVLFAKSIFANS